MELNNNLAVIVAVGRPLMESSRQDFENRSTITSMHVLPSKSGRSVMKSTPRCDHGRLGMGNGRSFPAGKWQRLLEMAHVRTDLGRTFSHPWPCWATSSGFSAARGCCWRDEGSSLSLGDILYSWWAARRSGRGSIGGVWVGGSIERDRQWVSRVWWVLVLPQFPLECVDGTKHWLWCSWVLDCKIWCNWTRWRREPSEPDGG